MRYVIVGTSGAGKTTFAREFAAARRLPYIELDDLHWSSNWTPKAPDEFSRAVQQATEGAAWVLDGSYSAVRGIYWQKATHIVWLNFSRTTVFTRIIRRTIWRTLTRQKLWAGNIETFTKSFLSRQSILLWSFTTYARNKSRYAALRSSPESQHLVWHEFTRPSHASEFARQARSDA
jgi:adenylate kinase family enzyme